MTASSATVIRYIGPLTAERVAEGINLTTRNAKRLYDDAVILLESGRYASALALAAIAIEEAGKSAILRRIACTSDPKELKLAWAEFRRHTSKNGAWVLPELVAKGARRLKELEDTVAQGKDHNHLLDTVKQLSLYADCFGKAHWSEPTTVVSKELANQIVFSASALCSRQHITTQREIELWIEIVAPKLFTPEAGAAILEWNTAMRREQLSEISDDRLREFLGEMIVSKEV